MWLVSGLSFLGLLVGFLAGMSSAEIVKPLIGLLFAFVGGSIFAVLKKLSSEDRSLAGKMLTGLSLFCLLGVTIGFYTSRRHILLSGPLRDRCEQPNPPAECYLHNNLSSEASVIDAARRRGDLTQDEAYAQLLDLTKKKTSSSGASK